MCLTNAGVLENLDKLMLSKGRRATNAVIGLENHAEEGGIHFHLAFKVDKKLNITNPNYFDCLTVNMVIIKVQGVGRI